MARLPTGRPSRRTIVGVIDDKGRLLAVMAFASPPTAPGDLAKLISRFRNEAGLDVSAVASGPASITVEFLPRAKLQALVPQASCFVAPNVSNWVDYKASRRGARGDWSQMEQRVRMAVFVPSDTAPQEVRDCLHARVLLPLLLALGAKKNRRQRFSGIVLFEWGTSRFPPAASRQSGFAVSSQSCA